VSLQAGQAFGNYRIISRIGVGGMGEVFLAEHPRIGKKVALKVIHRELAGNREVVSRFLNEARAVNQIGNEHIVEIHDFGQTDAGGHFFIMEYLDGRTLAAELHQRGGSLPTARALHIGAQIASGLGAAHDRHIIHRDLKPDNVMLIERLGDRDFVKLLDFGLAKFLSEVDARKLTAAGVVLGTPQFMSPEACETRRAVDHRSDIYSLGILLFQMLTGTLPFDGETMGEVLVKQVAQPPPVPRAIQPEVPPAVEQVVLRCLVKDPAGRFQTMIELRDALLDPNRYLASSPPVVPVAAAPPARTSPASTVLGMPGRSMGQAVVPAPAPRQAADRGQAGVATQLGVPEAGASQGRPKRLSELATSYKVDAAAQRMYAGHLRQAIPQPVDSDTMEIGTPYGHKNRPPRRWPLLLGVLALLGATAAAAALVLSAEPGAESATGSAKGSGATAGEPPATVRISLSTRPAGAEVHDGEGRLRGTTPMVIEMSRGDDEVVLVFRHPDAAEREARFVPNVDAAIDVELVATAPEPPGEDGAGASAAPGADAAARGADAGPSRPRARRDRPRRKVKRSARDGLLRPDL
jgi:serine/threonine-protein kinase